MKARKITFGFTFALILLICLFVLCGCNSPNKTYAEEDDSDDFTIESQPTEHDGKTVLRVIVDQLPKTNGSITESQTNSGFMTQLSLLLLDFKIKHNDVEIVIEEVPSGGSPRKTYLQRLNSEIMAGEGPDVFLLRNEFTTTELQNYYEPVFDDVNLLMRNGIFYDISTFYDADFELHTEKLRKEIMDAGVIDGTRYVLPLRYDFPILYVDKDKSDERGVDLSFATGTISDFLTAGAKAQDDVSASCFWMNEFLHNVFNFFPELIDYDDGKVILSSDELEAFLGLYQPYLAACLAHPTQNLELITKRGVSYIDYKNSQHWMDSEPRFMQTGSLNDLMENVSIAKAKEISLEVYPLKAADGSIIADVTFYGAIAAGCKSPELAYEFLREWLTEDFQWEKNLISGNQFKLSSYGWPVRTEGSYAAIAKAWMDSWTYDPRVPFELTNLSDTDFSILNAQIDVVRFGVPKLEYELGNDMWKLANAQYGALPVDLTEKTQRWLKMLQTHLDEG